MTGIPASQPESWENEGQALAYLLDECCAVVVASLDSNVASSVAIGLARVHGTRRRVAIADLVGESPPLEALNRSDDPHGISDSFLYGVSLNRIAHQVNAAGSVFLMPSGTESVTHEHVYANERWRRLAAGFQQVGALLVIVAVPGTPGFAELCGYIGAILPVGDTRFSMPPGVPIIAPVEPPAPPPRTTPSRAAASAGTAAYAYADGSSPASATPSHGSRTPRSSATPQRAQVARAREAAIESNDGRRRRMLAGVGVLFAVALGVGTFWSQIVSRLPAPLASWLTPAVVDTAALLVKPTVMDSASAGDGDDTSGRGDTLAADTTGANAALTPDSASGRIEAASSGSGVPSVANPADARVAARFAIFYTSANTRESALVDARVKDLPAVSVTPLMLDGSAWYRVFIGASVDSDGARMLLTQLRARKLIGGGSVISVPYALRLERGVPATQVTARLADYGKRGILAYALQQADGSAILYTGAFESPSQALILADSLRALGLTPVLAYRTGRGI